MVQKTLQEVFDTVARHLLTQGKQAKFGDSCRYRTAEGLTCAIGCMIPDSVYFEAMEGRDVRDLDPALLEDCGLGNVPIELLKQFQRMHDSTCSTDPVSTWKFELKDFAGRYNLDKSVLAEF